MSSLIRALAYLSLFGLMFAWESKAPRRPQQKHTPRRWANNLLLTVGNAVMLQGIFKGAAVGTAYWAQARNWGILNQLRWPMFLKFTTAVVLLDILIYWQHRWSHQIPLLWRLHRVHHSDTEIDVSSAARFHPFEAFLSMCLKIFAIVTLGAGPVSVLSFELLLNLGATFNHSNIRIAQKAEKLLRKVLITPDLHRIHHSVVINEQNSNYGFSVSFWDRLFGSYRDQACLPQEEIVLGDAQLGEDVESLNKLLFQIPLQPTRASD